MQKLFLFLVILVISINAGAQVKRIYGYVQDISGGAMQDDDASGNNSNKEKRISSGNRRHFIFAEVNKGKPVLLKQVWIEGSLYSFKTDSMVKLPFILQSSNGGEMIFRDTLVKSSNDMLIQLKDLVKTKHATIPKNIRIAVIENDVVITFRYNNKLLFTTLKKLTKLTSLFAQ